MTHVVTYTDDVEALVMRATDLANQGLYPEFIRLDPESGVAVIIPKLATFYSDTGASLSVCVFPLKEVIGDENDEDFVPFFDVVGMEALAYGTPRTDTDPVMQVKNNPEALAKYETVLPPLPVLDEDGNPTGEFEFNHIGEFDVGAPND